MTAKEQREVRLAAQLRANLRRRKVVPAGEGKKEAGGEQGPSTTITQPLDSGLGG